MCSSDLDSTYKLIKTKDISDDEAVYSKQLFEGLFLNGDTVSLKELPEEFSMYADAAGNAIAAEHVGEKSLSSSSAAMIRILAVIMSALPFMAVFANSSLINMGTVYFPLLGLGGLLTLGLIALMARNYDKTFCKIEKIIIYRAWNQDGVNCRRSSVGISFYSGAILDSCRIFDSDDAGCIIVCYKNSEAYTLCQSNARKVARF